MKLETVFTRIADQANRLDDLAGQILAAIQEARARRLDQFESMVRDAYEANGWHYRPGRPTSDATGTPVPDAVRTYVSEVRAAYRLKLPIMRYRSMYQLRQAVRRARAKTTMPHAVEGPAEQLPELRGVRVYDDDHLTGALLHDLVVVYEHAPDPDREKLQASLRRLLSRFRPVARNVEEAA